MLFNGKTKKDYKKSDENLIIPIYINEKIIIDLLAIIEDGFSTVSQINYNEQYESNSVKKMNANGGTSATLMSNLFKINVSSDYTKSKGVGISSNISKEKVHTNVSLFSKVRSYLISHDMMKADFSFQDIKEGDFIEVNGELRKNPIINYMDLFLDLMRLSEVFTDEARLGERKKQSTQLANNNKTINQIKSFRSELTHSGTLDFVLGDSKGTIVLSVQEQYLSNDNISEILGGHFKVLGKVIYVCPDKDKSIDLLRKTSLSILSDELLRQGLDIFKNQKIDGINMPPLETKICGPVAIVIPIAIYA